MKKLLILFMLSIACKSGEVTNPEEPPVVVQPPNSAREYSFAKVGQVPKEIGEKSGICMAADGRFYIIQDSGQPSNVSVLGKDHKLIGSVKMKGVKNTDFEDVACHGTTIVVGDIGDNDQERGEYQLYMFPAPLDPNATVTPERVVFKYEDGRSRNAEGLAFSPDGRLYLSTKAFNKEPQAIYEIVGGTARKVMSLSNLSEIGGLAISPDGRRFLLAMDESNEFIECTWDMTCETIETPWTDDHEAVAYDSDSSFVLISEDDTAVYRVNWSAKLPSEQPTAPTKPVGYYVPKPGTKFQILDSDDGDWTAQVAKKNAELIVVEAVPGDDRTCADGYADIAAKIEKLHAKGKEVSCYQSLSKEPWRCDMGSLSSSAVGKKMAGWDEWWTDWRVSSRGHAFWDNRYVQFQKIGCDCVEDDNEVDPSDNDTGFPLSRADAEAASRYRAGKAQTLGMCHLAKNNPTISDIKAKYSDGVMIEEAAKYNERAPYNAWARAGKFMGSVEYSSSGCRPWTGASVQYHPGGGYFDGLKFKDCD